MSNDIAAILRAGVQKGASDVFLSPEEPPIMRVGGVPVALEGFPPLSADVCRQMIYSVLSAEQRTRFEADWELDVLLPYPGVGRFRANVSQQNGGVAMVLRVLADRVPTPQELGLPQSVLKFTELPRGLVLITGPTGSGKTTTLGCLVEHINQTQKKHVITIEDPIEFLFKSKNSLVNQRQVGLHTKSFPEALKRALRQNPDVIFIGEMRDLETIEFAVNAAETGHLCLAALHTQDAPSSIDRIVGVFPASQQAEMRLRVSMVLAGVLSQTLLPRVGGGRVCAREVMAMTPAIANLIREGKTHQLPAAIEAGGKFGMVSIDQYLAGLVKQGALALEDALVKARDPYTVKTLAAAR